jgi:HSP20 family protein
MSAQTATQSQSSQGVSGTSQKNQPRSLARMGSIPPVPSLLLDPLSIFGESPFSLFGNMQQEMSRLFGGPLRGRNQQASQNDDFTTLVWAPPVELEFRDGNLVVSAELPGLTEKDVTIEVNDDVLIIRGERSDEREEAEGGIRRTERRYGQFYRAIALPDGADPEKARAEFENGMLHVTIPMEQSKLKQIPIQAGNSSQATQSRTGEQKTTGSETQSGQRSESQPGQKAA